ADGEDDVQAVPGRHEGPAPGHEGHDGRRFPRSLPRALKTRYNPRFPGRPGHPVHRPRTAEQTDMVKIRLTRGGAKKRPFYHIIVTDQRNKRDGRSIERLGYYNPVAQGNEKRVELDTERVKHWVSHGAQLTEKVSALVKEVSSAKAAA